MGDSKNNLDDLLNEFSEEQDEKEEEKRLLKEQIEQEEQKRLLEEKEYEERQKTAEGRHNATENIQKLRQLSQAREKAGICMNKKEYSFGKELICISADIVDQAKIRKLIANKVRALCDEIFNSEAVVIDSIEDITEKFFPAVKEQIMELCEFYHSLCSKLGVCNQTVDEVYEEFAEEWLDEEFLGAYSSVFEKITQTVIAFSTDNNVQSSDTNMTFDVEDFIRYKVLYNASVSAMLKVDAVDAAQNLLGNAISSIAKGYQKSKFEASMKGYLSKLKELVSRYDFYIAKWGYEMEVELITMLQENELLVKEFDEEQIVNGVAAYIFDDMNSDKKLNEGEIEDLCKIMISNDPSDSIVEALFLWIIWKNDYQILNNFLIFIEDMGCWCSFITALYLLDKENSKKLDISIEEITKLSLKEKEELCNCFDLLIGKTTKKSEINRIVSNTNEVICKAIKREKDEIKAEKEETERQIEFAKRVCSFTAEKQLSEEYLQQQLELVAEIRACITYYNPYSYPNDINKCIFKYTWQTLNHETQYFWEDDSEKQAYYLIQKYNLGNEYVFDYKDDYLITDKALYKYKCLYSNWTFEKKMYDDMQEIIPVSLCGGYTSALLIKEDNQYRLEYFKGSEFVLYEVIEALMRRKKLSSELYGKTFVYCRNCKKIYYTDPDTLKKCPGCGSKAKKDGWRHKASDSWKQLNDEEQTKKLSLINKLKKDIARIDLYSIASEQRKISGEKDDQDVYNEKTISPTGNIVEEPEEKINLNEKLLINQGDEINAVEEYIVKNFDDKTKVQAIVYYREQTGEGLQEAKDRVEEILSRAAKTKEKIDRREYMFCTNCGRKIKRTAKYCNYCGTPNKCNG